MNCEELNKYKIKGLYRESLTFAGRPEMGQLARSMQKITEHAMEEMGINLLVLKEKQLLWVICFSHINLMKQPEPDEECVMFTWPGAGRMGMFSRRYVMFSASGEELFTCTSLFSVVDEKTRAMVLPENSGLSLPVITISGEPGLPKLKEIGPEPDAEFTHRVESHEIDINNHVNNACYFDWIEPVIRDFAESSTQMPLKSIWINYSNEVVYGDEVVIRYAAEKDVLFIKGYVKGSNSFTIKVC